MEKLKDKKIYIFDKLYSLIRTKNKISNYFVNSCELHQIIIGFWYLKMTKFK